ncbi:MAG: hypothetical protein QMC81_02180 [Thermoanaerobacterales bacterium]|nr:hypothetical protein [Bacillota bacterium]MDI6906283.1 hypothetical protein [Thermoanaerobacterales bacterium]
MRVGFMVRRAAAAARKRVSELRASHPGLTERELAEILIGEKARASAAAGALTALPAVFPGVGTLVALAAGLAADIGFLKHLLERLVLELAVLYGRDPLAPDVRRELSWVLAFAAGVDGAGKRMASYAAGVAARQAPIASLAGRYSLSLGFKAAQKSVFFRVLPLLGIAAVGALNYFFVRGLGRRMLTHFAGRESSPWAGRTMDADFRVEA